MAKVPIESLDTGVIAEGTSEPVFINVHDNESAKEISWVVGNDDGDVIVPPKETKPEPDKETVREEDSEDAHEEEGDEEDEEAPKKRKNKVTAQRRIADLTRKLKAAHDFTHDVMNQKENVERQLAATVKAKTAFHENLLATRKEQIKREMIRAHEEGDSQAYAEANDLMSQYNTEMMRIQNEKQAGLYEPYRSNNYVPDDMFDTSDPYPEPMDDNAHKIGMSWIKRNPWADKNSSSFRPALAQQADQFSLALEDRYVLEGREDEIGSPEFWEDISDYMADSYGAVQKTERQEEPRKRQMTMRSPRGSAVAPPSRRSVDGSSRNQARDMQLSREQIDFARSMRGFVKDAKGNKNMDNKGLEEAYKRNLRGE